MALVQPELCAAPEKIAAFCKFADEPDTYRVQCEDATVLEALCALAHRHDKLSGAHCVRDHPHDAHVRFSITRDELDAAVPRFDALIQNFTFESTNATECDVECASFLEANVLRRSLLTMVDVLACTEVCVTKNTSNHEDWLVVHRCGQIAIVGERSTCAATVHVVGRTALGRDLRFTTDVRVADGDLDAPLLEMHAGQEFIGALKFQRGTPVSHARFHSSVSPSYRPDVRFSRAPTSEQRRRLWEYDIPESNVCTRRDGRPCRAEVLRELDSGLPEIIFGPRVTVGVESFGQMPAAECARRALKAARAESHAILNSIRECGTVARAAASGAGGAHR